MHANSPCFGEDEPAEWELRSRVALARREYERAIAEAKSLLEQAHDLGLGNADSVAAIRKANHAQQIATYNYSEALKALSEFVLDRTHSKFQ